MGIFYNFIGKILLKTGNFDFRGNGNLVFEKKKKIKISSFKKRLKNWC